MRGRSGGGCPEVNLALRGGTDALRSEPTSLHVSLSPAGLSQTSQRSHPREGPALPRPAAGTAASVPARATPGSPAPSLQPPGVEAAAEHGRVPRGFKGLSPGVGSRPGQRARPESPRWQHLWPRSSLPRHGRCMPRPAGAHLPGSRAGSRVQEIPPKDASPGRLSRQEPRELTDTFPNKVPLSRGTMTGGREKSRSEAHSNRRSAPERGRRSAGARKSDIRKDSESWTPRRAIKGSSAQGSPQKLSFSFKSGL